MVSDEVTHVVVGYSRALLAHLDRVLPAGSVLVVEEPEICAKRNAVATLPLFPCFKELLQLPTQDEGNADQLAELIGRPAGVRAVLPGLEYAVVAAAALAEAWGLPGGGAQAVRAFRDKARLREAASGHGIAQPQWRLIGQAEEAARFRAEHGGECVIKPAHLQASLGVQLIGPQDDLDAAWAATVAADKPFLRIGYADSARYLVEERLHGAEFSVEALVHEGQIVFCNVTETQLIPGPHPVEQVHVVPAGFAPEDTAAAASAMAALVAATGFRTGILHAEWIRHDGRPHLVECAARIPGGEITRLIDLAYNTDLIAAYVSVLEGGPAKIEPVARQGAAVRFLTAAPGVVQEIRGVEAARELPGVLTAGAGVEPGQEVYPVTSSWAWAGEVIALGADPAEAAQNAQRAAEAIEIVTG